VTEPSSILSIPSWPITGDATRDVFARMTEDGSWGRYHGPHCETLVAALCEYHGVEHSILCSSGTCAIELALRAIPVAAGDEVILAAYDFKANFVNVLTTGCTPVLVDTIVGYPVPDPDQIAEAVTDRTRAIIVSHLHGNLVPMREVCRIAADRGVVVIEDAFQAPGAQLEGRRAGTHGNVGVLSFGGSKLLTSGRGGAVLTSDAQMAQRIRLYTQRGNEAYPLSEMQAAVVRPQLLDLDARNAFRHQRLRELVKALGNGGICPAMNLQDEAGAVDYQPAFYKSAFLLPQSVNDTTRKQFCDSARRGGVPVDPGFSGLHRIHSRQRFRAVGSLPHATQLHERLISLHHTALLSSAETVKQIAEILQDCFDDGYTRPRADSHV
jgi:perosamine synthetase